MAPDCAIAAGLSHGQPFDLFTDAICPSWLSIKRSQGSCYLPAKFFFPFFSRFLSLVSHSDDSHHREHLKKKQTFMVIKHQVFSGVIEHCDTFILFCLIYGCQTIEHICVAFWLHFTNIALYITGLYFLMQAILLYKKALVRVWRVL